MDKIEDIELVVNNNELHEVKPVESIGLSDIKTNIDHTKSVQEQIEDVVDIASSVSALKDENTIEQITEKKKEEILEKADVKVKKAKQEATAAETDLQKAKREKFALLFDTFGVTKHIPEWLLKTLMFIFAPFYVLFVIIIGIPTGFVRFLIDCIDGILIRYDDVDGVRKGKLKATVWVILVLVVLATASLVTLKCCGVI